MYFFYIMECADKTLYCGATKDLVAREQLHNQGKGARYTRSHGGGKIVYHESFETYSQALKREAAVKKWSRTKKLELILI